MIWILRVVGNVLGLFKRIRRGVVNLGVFRLAGTFRALPRFLLPHTMDASTGVNGLVNSPVRALAAISQWAGDLLETWVEGEIVADRVLVGHG